VRAIAQGVPSPRGLVVPLAGAAASAARCSAPRATTTRPRR